jgi:hypothetical protein
MASGWWEPTGLTREKFRTAPEYRRQQKAALRVYVGQGSLNMTHNMGGVWASYQGAAIPGTLRIALICTSIMG